MTWAGRAGGAPALSRIASAFRQPGLARALDDPLEA
jgi:hypothetical protein